MARQTLDCRYDGDGDDDDGGDDDDDDTGQPFRAAAVSVVSGFQQGQWLDTLLTVDRMVVMVMVMMMVMMMMMIVQASHSGLQQSVLSQAFNRVSGLTHS